MRTLPEAPSGCRHCGVAEKNHPWLWIDGIGRHQYEAPSDQQVKQRMRERRQQKENQ